MQIAKPKWKDPKKDLIIPELKKYFAVVMYMGVHKLPNRQKCWHRSGIFQSDFVRSCMTLQRFNAITSCLHHTNTARLTAAERAARNKENGFWTVEGLINALAVSFRFYYTCGRFIDIDEMCILFKSRHRCKCYNPNKPNKWHFKAFCLNDSKSGHLSNFFMYRGKDEKRPDGMSATAYPVYMLTDPVDYHNKGHMLAEDNW